MNSSTIKQSTTSAPQEAQDNQGRGLAAGIVRTMIRYLRGSIKTLRGQLTSRFRIPNLHLPERMPKLEIRLPRLKLRLPEYNLKPEFRFRIPERMPTFPEFRMRPKIVSRSAEQARSAMEFGENFHGVNSEHRRRNSPPAPSRVDVSRVAPSKPIWRVLGADAARSLPGFLRSIALTSLLFSFYEECVEHLHGGHPLTVRVDLLPSIFGIGLVGGLGHGALYSASDALHQHLRGTAIGHKHYRAGAALTHGLVFASLFGSYECTKYAAFKLLDIKERNTAVAGVCTAGAGASSGFVSEIVLHYTKQLQYSAFEGGKVGIVSSVLRALREIQRPTLLACTPGVVMATFGFLAYEYAEEG